MQVLERPRERNRATPPSSHGSTSLRTTTLTALTQRQGSGYSREFIRESVMAWAARKWPELLIGRDACGIGFQAHSDFASVHVSCAGDEDDVWTFKGTGAHGPEGMWETCVLVLGGQDHDLLTVRTGYRGHAEATPACAQPKFLCALIEHLSFDDGGHGLSTAPRQVFSLASFDDFHQHLLSGRRTLPILAVRSEVASRDPAIAAPDPAVLARALCGVAHVVSLGAVGASCLEGCLGGSLGVSPGEARLFMPGLAADADPGGHPAFRSLQGSLRSEAGDVEAAVQTATHSWSTSLARRADFEALWARSGGT